MLQSLEIQISKMKKITITTLVYLLGFFAIAQDRITGQNFATRSEIIAQHGMACTSQPLATQVALDILKAGGNAIDAAIAADAVLGLTEPTGSGIGGDIFAIVWDAKTHKLYGLNGSGRSPYELKIQYFKENGYEKIPSLGPLSVSVPGCVDGWFELNKKFGKLTIPEILAPAIRYAREGFPVSEVIAYYWQSNARSLQKFPGFSEIYMPGGKTPAKGEIAEKIVAYLKEQGGFFTKKDFEDHTSEWVDPVSSNYCLF